MAVATKLTQSDMLYASRNGLSEDDMIGFKKDMAEILELEQNAIRKQAYEAYKLETKYIFSREYRR